MLDVALVSSFLGNATNIVQRLKDEKIVSHEGLIIYHSKKEVEYRLDLVIGDQKSRAKKFTNFLKSKTLKKISLDALEVTATGINNENLIEMGLITWEDTQISIDFPRIFREVNSGLVIIIIRTRFPTELTDKLIHRQISKINSLKNGKLVSNFELVLDYANMWYSHFTSLSVRNIVFTLNHSLPQDEIKKLMMEELSTKLSNADKKALKKENARKYLLEFQKVILELQDQDFVNKLYELIEINPPTNGIIENIRPALKVYNLEYSRIPLTIPDLFVFYISANIEDRETAIHATVTFNLEKFREMLKEKFRNFKMKNRKLKF